MDVFIFAVCGRSSSTTLQRILNSSNEICIWGEQFHLIDDLMKFLSELDKFIDDDGVIWNVHLLINSFRNQFHLKPYPLAIGNILKFRLSLIEALCKSLTLPELGIDRFGFKCIRLKSKITLQMLRKIFPKSYFVFLFRDPVKQWPSLNHLKWWDYSHELQDFLNEYFRISSIILEYYSQNDHCILIENSDIRKGKIFNEVLARIKIKSVDPEVVKRDIFSVGNTSAAQSDYKNIIKKHKAYKNYHALKKLKIHKI